MNNFTVFINNNQYNGYGNVRIFMGGKMNYNFNKHFPSNKQLLLTKKGLDCLKVRLNRLNKERISMCKRLMKMNNSEREEYRLSTNAINILERNEAEITNIADILQRADVVEPKEYLGVELGSTVSLEMGSQKKKYTVVDSIEADPSENKISLESPLGKALIGKKKQSDVYVSSPKGRDYHYKLLDIA